MSGSRLSLVACTLVCCAAIGGALSVFFSPFLAPSRSLPPRMTDATAAARNPIGNSMYAPPKPEDAPADIRDAVLLGYNIMVKTREYAAPFVGNQLTCTSCHFNGGITKGPEAGGGLSLVGVAAKYPIYRQRELGSVDLTTRTNNCFERSMNGKPLPPDSKEMTALITYYQWISKGVPIYAEVPWLGLPALKGDHTPNPTAGKVVYSEKCAACHGKEGEGNLIGPPLWGPGSFNNGAGMHRLPTFAAFTYYNMPKGNPGLTVEESLDVAAYVATKPRPQFRGARPPASGT